MNSMVIVVVKGVVLTPPFNLIDPNEPPASFPTTSPWNSRRHSSVKPLTGLTTETIIQLMIIIDTVMIQQFEIKYCQI